MRLARSTRQADFFSLVHYYGKADKANQPRAIQCKVRCARAFVLLLQSLVPDVFIQIAVTTVKVPDIVRRCKLANKKGQV